MRVFYSRKFTYTRCNNHRTQRGTNETRIEKEILSLVELIVSNAHEQASPIYQKSQILRLSQS